MTDVANQESGEEFETPQTEGANEVEEQDLDEGQPEDGSQDDEEDEEFEEVERGDKKYRIPKALKPDLLREDDYRRKTMSLADDRRAFEAERVKSKEDNEAIEEARFAHRAVQKRLSDLQALQPNDWETIRHMDARDGTDRYNQLQREFLTLPRQADESKRTLDSKVQEVADAEQATLATRVSEGQAILQRDIPGWGPELGAKLTDFVKADYGITEQAHGRAFMDPAMVKLAHAAYQAKQSQRKQTVLKTAENATKVQPVKPTRGGAIPSAGLDDRLSTAEWMKRDRELTAKKMGRR